MSNRVRQEYIKVRVTPDEKRIIKNKVNLSQTRSMQRYGLTMLLQGGITHVDYKELISLQWEIKKIGNNINQVVRLANQFSEISSQDIKNLTDELNNLSELVEKEFKKEIRRETIIYKPDIAELGRRD